ncbi:MAG: AmmeMemoRadiSam system protein A [Spirochaetes bacterium]|nr:AmmeMemoRadiSam system protein A [Spirochaetota bacterium]
MKELTREQQINLLKLARATIYESLAKKDFTGGPAEDAFSDPVFKEKCGAFVTLHIKGSLRGCIGYIQGMRPIPDTIIEMAKASAFHDPRFSPLTIKEYEKIDIEISVLTPIEEVKDIAGIVVGRDGIIISRGARSGLLLPQVATEQNWDLRTFLEHTCYKAGLPGDAWTMKETKIEKFSAQVFGEKDLGLINQ